MNESIDNKKNTKAKTVANEAKLLIFGYQYILLFVLIVALIGAGIFCWQLSQRLAQITMHNEQQVNSIMQLQNKLIHQKKLLHQQQQELTTQQTQLQRLLLKQKDQTQHQVLLSIKHLLYLAELNLQFMHDIDATIDLLKLADEQLQPLSDTHIVSLRQTLAQNLLALQAIKQIDTAGYLVKLTTIAEQVQHLPLLPGLSKQDFSSLPTSTKEKTHSRISSATVDNAPHSKNWRQYADNLWQQMKQLVVIRHWEQPIEPLLAPGQRVFLEQNLQLYIEQAKWALLRSNNSIYQDSLRNCINLIKKYFDTNEVTTKAVLEQLNALSSINIAPAVPDLINVQQQLEKVMQQP
ncbi:MAG: hypothetical protein Tsb005_18500 [Gammaproteobacteria bacterium]